MCLFVVRNLHEVIQTMPIYKHGLSAVCKYWGCEEK